MSSIAGFVLFWLLLCCRDRRRGGTGDGFASRLQDGVSGLRLNPFDSGLARRYSLPCNEKWRRGDTDVTTNRDVVKPSWYAPDAWRVGQEPEAITEAVEVGEQIMGLFIQAATLIEQACQNVELIIENTAAWCQMIVDQLMREALRLIPILTRLQAAHRAVAS